jgi:hypothetical protein
MKLVALLTLLFLVSAKSMACQFDTDCSVGSKCYKPNDGIIGWCVGGINQGNQNDDKPARDPLDLTGKRGSTCSFDTDCGVGGKCVKGSGIYGTCL